MSQAISALRAGAFIPAMPLALDEKRALDERRQRALIRYYVAAGVDGLAVGVHTTQFAIRDPQINLFERVLALAADELAKQESALSKTLIKVAGVCGDTAQSAQEAKLAAEYGYDAVLLSPGGLADMSEAQLVDRTRAVSEILPVIGFYLQPSVGGRLFTADYWSQIAAIPGVAAIKIAPFNRYQTLDVVRAVALSPRADQVALYTGNDDSIVTDLLTPFRFTVDGVEYEKRFVGGLLGHWAVWTKTAVEMFRRLKQVAARPEISMDEMTLAAQVTDANGAFFDVANGFAGCIAGIHEVLRRQGLLEGIWCLDPHETLSPGQSREIDRVYEMYPHLSDDEFVRAHLNQFLA